MLVLVGFTELIAIGAGLARLKAMMGGAAATAASDSRCPIAGQLVARAADADHGPPPPRREREMGETPHRRRRVRRLLGKMARRALGLMGRKPEVLMGDIIGE